MIHFSINTIYLLILYNSQLSAIFVLHLSTKYFTLQVNIMNVLLFWLLLSSLFYLSGVRTGNFQVLTPPTRSPDHPPTDTDCGSLCSSTAATLPNLIVFKGYIAVGSGFTLTGCCQKEHKDNKHNPKQMNKMKTHEKVL